MSYPLNRKLLDTMWYTSGLNSLI